MKARIKVLPSSAQIPSAATDKKAVDKQVARAIAELKPGYCRSDSEPKLAGLSLTYRR